MVTVPPVIKSVNMLPLGSAVTELRGRLSFCGARYLLGNFDVIIDVNRVAFPLIGDGGDPRVAIASPANLDTNFFAQKIIFCLSFSDGAVVTAVVNSRKNISAGELTKK